MKFLQSPFTFSFNEILQQLFGLIFWTQAFIRFFLFILAGKKETQLPNRLLLIPHKEHKKMDWLVMILVLICLSFV